MGIPDKQMIIKKAEKKVVEEVNPYDWPENYYMETAPERRKAILEAREDPAEAEANKIRMALWDKRYEKIRGDQLKDNFLAAWLDMMLVLPQVDSRFGKKKARQQVEKALAQMCIPQVDLYGKELLLEELKHTVLLYCSASMEDRQYGSVIFGLGKMKKDNVRKKISAELHNVGTYIPEKLDLTAEAALLTEAVELAKEHMGF